MPDPNKPNSVNLRLAIMNRYGIYGMRYGEKDFKLKAQHEVLKLQQSLAHQARLDQEATSQIAEAMEMEVKGNRRRSRADKENHIRKLLAIHSRMNQKAVDAKLLIKLIKSKTMGFEKPFKPLMSAKGSVAVHSDPDRSSSANILKHAAFLKDLSEQFEVRASTIDDEIEEGVAKFSGNLKPIEEMTNEELVKHYK